MAKLFTIVLTFLLFGVPGFSGAATSEQFVDPMRPVNYQNSAAKTSIVGKKERVSTKGWKLLAVLTSTERSVAVINGRSLQLGDHLEGFKLVKIDPDKVVLKNKQTTLVLRRAGTGLKKMSANKDIRKGSKP